MKYAGNQLEVIKSSYPTLGSKMAAVINMSFMDIITLIYFISARLVDESLVEISLYQLHFEFQVKISLVVRVFVCRLMFLALAVLNAWLKIVTAL